MPQRHTAWPGSHRARVFDATGNFSQPQPIAARGGRFVLGEAAVRELADPTVELGERWIIPGIVDAHVHASWHHFQATDRSLDSPAEQEAKTRAVLERMLREGITSLRDGGGLTPELAGGLAEGSTPRAQTSITMIGGETREQPGGILGAVEIALAAGARWIKLVATASVSSPPDSDLEAVFTSDEVAQVVQRAGESDARVMVHAWGGPAIDDAIEAGAGSIEHGIYLSEEQAKRAAERGLTLVPTLRIYRLVQQLIAVGQLPGLFRRRVDDAVSTHAQAVRFARDAGMPIALGSDYGTTAQHGTNRLEFDALVAAGLSASEALLAATTRGAELLLSAASEPERHLMPNGRISAGSVADAVVFREDPREPGAFSDPESIVAVICDGRTIEPSHREEHQ